MSETEVATPVEYAVARYRGVAVWGSIDPPRDQVRSLEQHERVQLLAEHGDGWLQVRLLDGREGLVRRDGLRAPAAQDAPRAGTWVASETLTFPTPFPGSERVALGLTIFAWLALIGGQLFGIGAAAAYECNEFLSTCDDEAGARVVLYFTFAVPSLVTALFAFGISYCLLLLRHLEQGQRLSILPAGATHTAEAGPVSTPSTRQAPPASIVDAPRQERCEVCGNMFAGEVLVRQDDKRMCHQCQSATRL